MKASPLKQFTRTKFILDKFSFKNMERFSSSVWSFAKIYCYLVLNHSKLEPGWERDRERFKMCGGGVLVRVRMVREIDRYNNVTDTFIRFLPLFLVDCRSNLHISQFISNRWCVVFRAWTNLIHPPPISLFNISSVIVAAAAFAAVCLCERKSGRKTLRKYNLSFVTHKFWTRIMCCRVWKFALTCTYIRKINDYTTR